MVTTYSTRLLNLPILAFGSSGTAGKKRKHVEAPSSGDGAGGRGNGTRENLPAMSRGSKRPAPSPGRFYAHVPPHHGDAAARRRRQREEWQYAAANVQQALREAGRPPADFSGGRGALPGARAVASSEFDREEGDAAAREQVENKSADMTTQVVDDPYYGYGDVSSMCTIAGLIRSTQGYYSFDAGDASPPPASEGAPSEHSEALSSWAPSGPSDDLNDNRRKDVDDDNRSDGQSSCPDGGEEEGSLSSEGPGGAPGGVSPVEDEVAFLASVFSIVG